MTVDLEDRLRAMYGAVAERTVLDAPAADPVPEPPVPETRRGRMLALAAVAVVVVLVLALLAVRNRETTPVGPPTVRPYAVPTAIPQGFGLEAAQFDDHNAVSGFVDMVPTVDTVAFVKYSGGGGKVITISATTSPTATFMPGGEPVALGAGLQAQWYADIETLAWRSPDGSAVSVRTQGLSRTQAESLANSLWYVDQRTFTTMTAKDGYVNGEWMRWTPPGDSLKNHRLTVSGSLQKGLQVGIANFGWLYGDGGGSQCRGQWLDQSQRNRETILVADDGVETFHVALPDGTSQRTVPAASAPGLPLMRFATVVVRDAPSNWQRSAPVVTCDGGGS